MTTATINNLVYRFIGTTDEVTGCDCCGRQGLKMTIVLQPTEGGDMVFFGSQCGARALGWAVKDVTTTAKNADKERRNAVRAALQSHPLQAIIDREITECNAIFPRMTYEARTPFMRRWSEMGAKIQSDVAELFGISIDRLRNRGY